MRSSGPPNDASLATHVRGAARGLRIGIAVSTYHAEVTSAMRKGAERVFREAGGDPVDREVVEVPGAFELVAVCAALAQRGDFDAVIALGCIVRGETRHDEYIAGAVSTGLAKTIVETGVPISFGVLTCQSLEQATARAGGHKGNKGEEAMVAAIEVVRAIRRIRAPGGVTT